MPSRTRRRLLALVGSATGCLAGCLSGAPPAGDLDGVDGEWPTNGGGPGGARAVDAGPADPEPVWTTRLPDVRATGAPSLADGRLYVPVDAVSERARHRYRLHALDAATGDERWRVPLRSDPNPSPAVTAGRIVVSARRATERGRVVAFAKRYGDEEWLYDVDARLTAPPTADGLAVYVPDWQGRVHALSAHDGTVRWARRVGADGDDRAFADPVAVRDGTLYLGSRSGATGVLAVDAATGDERWSRSTDVVTAGPVVDDDLVVVRTHGLVAAFDPDDGTRRWTAGVPGDDGRPFALGDRHVYVPADGTLHAIDRDGDGVWTYDLSGGRVGTPTVAGDAVIVCGDGELVALSRTDGTRRWTTGADGCGEVLATPNALFTTGPGGRVYAHG
ncbi:PQQ-binding-like beta-propeller repeat protein [Salinilacihabitans rarus]|uniref:outer membrane protein assembly factor BamB family protein n=1 Tax=Salinilacihabitans rarus TaxID=2961596 RepID=UPI0020C88B81|nr:PQQ-binding-like beta-propeller repeat protein [Salinilacihabitans rarus]